ncbi:Uncharacterised protein [uncultured archaeon]|nr:Uncharacterised protein [uncultured archaeon]
MKNKKAQGHVEMIISFLIFIGAVSFIFVFLNPISQPKEKTLVMNNLEKKIMSNITSELGELFIVTDANDGCYGFDPLSYLNKNYFELHKPNTREYTIYFSEIFKSKYTTKYIPGTGCDPTKYTVGSYSEEEIISYDKVIELKTQYSGYNTLKKSFGISDDFSFSFRYLNGTQISEMSVSKGIPSGIVRKSEDIPIRVMNSSANIQELILNIMVW